MRCDARCLRLGPWQLAAAAALVVLAGCVAGTAGPASAQPATGDAADFLPLTVGARWELRSRTVPSSMVLEVESRDGEAFIVRWDNPWVSSTFRFEDDGSRVRMTGLDMGQGISPIPDDTVYWDFARARGDRWSSAVGTQQVTRRGERVETPAGTFADAVEIETRNQQGEPMYWTFAPGVGLVRFGRGRDAFLLTARREGRPGAATTAPPVVRPPVGPARPGRLLIGVDPNPAANTALDDAAKRASFATAIAAGMTFHYALPTWSSIERDGGRFEFADLDLQVALAERAGVPLALNLRILDAGQRAMPAAYARWNLDDRRMVDRLNAVLVAVAARTKGLVRWITLGNEVDSYFNSRRADIAPYARLLERVSDQVRGLFPNAQLSVNFTAGAAGQMDRYQAIVDQLDVISFSYYPLNADFTMREPSVADADIRQMVGAVPDKLVLFQEIGYASATRLNSSEARQAQFLERAFKALRAHADRIVHARFLFMADLPQPVVDSLASYYKAPNSENFKAYLETLGLFDQRGRPKAAWAVFEREARALRPTP